MISQIVFTLFLASNLAIAFTASAQGAKSSEATLIVENKTSSKIIKLEKDMQQLKTQLEIAEHNEKRASELLSLAQTVLGNAQEAMKTSQAEVHAIEAAMKIGGLVLAIVSVGLGFFGFRKYKDFTSHLDKEHERLNTHINSAQITIKAFRLSFEMLKSCILAFDRCKVIVENMAIWSNTAKDPDKREAARKVAFDETIQALDIIETVLPVRETDGRKMEDIKLIKENGDPPILGWAYQIYGFAKGNLASLSEETGSSGHQEALSLIEKGLELWPETNSGWYNAACFAWRVGKRDKTLSHLREAIKQLPSNAAKARKDSDFAKLWEDPGFKAITHQGL